MIRKKQKSSWIFALSLLLVSCTGDNDDLRHYIDDVKNRNTREVKLTPKFAVLSVFRFPEKEDRRSPFKPVNLKKQVNSDTPNAKRQGQPLEAFPLDALKFVGTLMQGDEAWALIEQPNMEITRVRIGDYMGQNYGRIVAIESDSLQLIETTRSSGKWKKYKTTINLYVGK